MTRKLKPKHFRMSELHPIHHSIRQLVARGWKVRGRDLDSVELPPEVDEGLQRVAMSIFIDCCNVGVPFQEALLAVYLSGLQHGSSIGTEQKGGSV